MKLKELKENKELLTKVFDSVKSGKSYRKTGQELNVPPRLVRDICIEQKVITKHLKGQKKTEKKATKKKGEKK